MKGEKTPRTQDSNTSKGSNRTSNSEKRSNQNQKKKKSRNSENKAALEIISLVRRRVKVFKKEHLGANSKFDYAACSECLEKDILQTWNMAPEDVKDYDEFLHLTLRKELDEKVMSSDEFIDLNSIAKRAQNFEIVVPDAKRRIQQCLDLHVEKSCVSLKEMSGDEVLIAVNDYDSNIMAYKEQIENKREEVDKNFKEYKELLSPFAEYVRGGENHSAMMNTVCNNILEMCKLVEDWVKDDDEYPDKLLHEFESNKKIKENLKDSLIETKNKREENKKEMEKLKRSEVRAGRHYGYYKQDKDRLKARKQQLQVKEDLINKKLEKKRDERDVMRVQRENNQNMSPRESNKFLDKLEKLEEDVAKLEEELKTTQKQSKRVDKDLKPVNDRTYEHKVDAVTQRHKREEIQKENGRLGEEMESIRDRMADIDIINQSLMVIREMKISPEAYRKNIKDKQKRDALQADGSLQLQEALKFAAPSIGSDWPKVYLHLPFDPPRETFKLHRDIYVMDDIAARRDITAEEQALKSLNKWRFFHRRGNVNELVETLKSVKKRQIANELEDIFII